MADCYFAIGTSLAALANVETIVSYPPHVLPDGAIPLVAPVRRRTLDQAVQRNGAIRAEARWDLFSQDDLNALILHIFGDYTTASKAYYASWLDETGHYSPFAVTFERPVVSEHYQITIGGWRREIVMPGWNWTPQSATKTANYTVTTSDRLVYADTSGGNVTLTLPAAATPNANTVFSFVKTSASNTLTLDGDGSETIDGAATKAVTTLNARVDLYSTGSTWISL